MTVTEVRKDHEKLTMTMTAEFDAPVERVWQMWSDPRKLERWWGPPTYPATFVDHDLKPGGLASYFMTSPEGEKYRGWWRVVAVDPPHGLQFEDGFADDRGEPNPEMPITKTHVTLSGRTALSTVMTIEATFPSAEAMEQVTAMGMEEGLTAAVGQIDALLVG